ncbi:mannose-1-phosphate guanylyltransferase [Cyclobacterium amurskyense]|uniref:mannose-1-phosphate guanylyltransferase n=1 Tax=Cyclobacterium amurskyense TaxID=320787 RepID=A0A0H4PH07_9BACT|nr:sugar phosphate nucleotidyltransferase [Cyclobacterium amurskyense]AKP52138.1 Nucleotidyl transferase [Cyclobacterium amurskyense]|tara:strand:- start:10580 stop:11656 length:1077 start_codon:yes stop_codon:yes gene_type:complete
MKKNDRYIVILAGGIGIKFWPSSRRQRPKQFLDLLGTGRTLLQMTYDRFENHFENYQFIIVTSKRYLSLVKEQLPNIPEDQILVEPMRRNTAASIALASYKIQKLNPNAKVLVSPSDQLIFNDNLFFDAVDQAMVGASTLGNLITIGIRPNRPDTNYGYIQFFPEEGQSVKKVKTFSEKPNLDLATTFIESGDFVWNTGTFVWKNESIIKAFEKYLPEMAEVFEEGTVYFCTEKENDFLIKAYSFIRNISIDHGIFEKSNEVFVVLGEFGWSDLGSWQNLYDVSEKDEENNTVKGTAMLYETSNCFINMPPNKLVVVQGLKDYLVSDSGDVLLICKLGANSKYKEYVTDAKKIGENYI